MTLFLAAAIGVFVLREIDVFGGVIDGIVLPLWRLCKPLLLLGLLVLVGYSLATNHVGGHFTAVAPSFETLLERLS